MIAADRSATHARGPMAAIPSRTWCGLRSVYEAAYVVRETEFGELATPPAPWCVRCGATMEHDDERHTARAEDGEAAPVADCRICEEAFPEWFAEMRAARREYDARPYHDPADHERGHPERPEIALRERVLGENPS